MELKDLRYNIMLALYFPILLYAFSTFDLSEESYAVNSLEPVVVADDMVMLGQPFEARTFLAVGGGEGQQLTGSGELVALGDSLLQMSTAALLEPGESEKQIAYSGTYRFQQLSGRTVDIPVAGQFRVKRPEIVAASEATQTLYRLCRNTIRIEVPGLEDRPLRLKAGGGEGVESRSITLSPSGEGAAIDVFLVDAEQGDVFLGKKQFSVIDPPRPELRVSNAGRELRNGENLPKARALLEFGLQADPEFQRRYPQDARYSIARARLPSQRPVGQRRDRHVRSGRRQQAGPDPRAPGCPAGRPHRHPARRRCSDQPCRTSRYCPLE